MSSVGFDRTPAINPALATAAGGYSPASQPNASAAVASPRRLGVVKNAPTNLAAAVERHRHEIVALAKQHHARAISVFGSVARGDAHGASDIDFLVEFEPHSSLLDLIHLEDALADLLGRPVDVVSAGGLLDRDDEIRRDAVAL